VVYRCGADLMMRQVFLSSFLSVISKTIGSKSPETSTSEKSAVSSVIVSWAISV
jgi:hypothetical protein